MEKEMILVLEQSQSEIGELGRLCYVEQTKGGGGKVDRWSKRKGNQRNSEMPMK